MVLRGVPRIVEHFGDIFGVGWRTALADGGLGGLSFTRDLRSAAPSILSNGVNCSRESHLCSWMSCHAGGQDLLSGCGAR